MFCPPTPSQLFRKPLVFRLSLCEAYELLSQGHQCHQTRCSLQHLQSTICCWMRRNLQSLPCPGHRSGWSSWMHGYTPQCVVDHLWFWNTTGDQLQLIPEPFYARTNVEHFSPRCFMVGWWSSTHTWLEMNVPALAYFLLLTRNDVWPISRLHNNTPHHHHISVTQLMHDCNSVFFYQVRVREYIFYIKISHYCNINMLSIA